MHTNGISKNTLKLENLVTIFSIIIYRILLDYIYINYVYKEFEYYHFKLDINIDYIIVSYIFMFFVAIEIPKLFENGKLSDIVLGLLIIMYFIPYTSLFAYNRHDIGFTLFVLFYFILLIVFNRIISLNYLSFKPYNNKMINDPKFFVVIIIVLGLIRIITSGIYTGFRISFDFSDYYEYRAQAREYSMPEIIRYLLGWSTTGLTIGLVYAIIKKNRLLSIYIIICTFLAFSFNGKKSVLFLLVLSILIALFYKQKYLKKIPIAFTFLSVLGTVDLIIQGNDSFVCKHFIRRFLFIPPNMSILHFDFFSSNEFDYLRTSVLRRLGFQSPYSSYGSIPRLIGAKYFGNQEMAMNANTGLCGDSFANFGYLSLLFAPLVIILTFKVLEWCCKNTDKKIQIVVAVFVAYSFCNGSYFTLLLTNGILFLMLLLSFLNNNKIDSTQKSGSLVNHKLKHSY